MSAHGSLTRRPVYTGNRRVPGLYERALANGATVYEARRRFAGQIKRHRLQAAAKTDAINELQGQLRLHVLPLLGRLPAAELTVADVRRLLDALAAKRLSPRSRSGLLGILSSVLTYGVRHGVVAHNVVHDLARDDRPGAQRKTEPHYLSPDELDDLLAKMGDTFRPIAAACAYAGLRLSEALGLRWMDVDFAGGTLTISAQLGPDGSRAPLKTAASAATIPLLPKLAAELKAHRSRVAGQALARVQPDALVFTTSRGRPHGRRNVLRAVYAAGDAAGLNGEGRERVGVHDLRHSFVAVALAAGLTLPEAAALARHANPRVTATVYAGLTDRARAGLGSKLAAAFGGG